jgi:hypothetical protein
LIFFTSCSRHGRDLGDRFILYKGDDRYPLSIGLDLGGGCVQGLLDGDIVEVGYDPKFITVRMRNEEYFFLEKAKILQDSADTENRGVGPLMLSQFNEVSKAKGLPNLERIK